MARVCNLPSCPTTAQLIYWRVLHQYTSYSLVPSQAHSQPFNVMMDIE